jgi:hypothetical protein
LHILVQEMVYESFALAAAARNTVAAPNKDYGPIEIKLFIEFTMNFLKV